MKKLLLLCSVAAVMPTTAFAQSTGSAEIEDKETIIVTGTRVREVGGVQAPDAAKAKAVLTQEMIARQNAGQTILDTVNLVPGVSFQNNDAYGSAGGTLTVRGFDSTRVSLTFDGIQLNDSGNYAIFSNQQMDPELIEQVNVNLGSTDVDSPTASAVGGTVNLRSMTPTRDASARFLISAGDFDFLRFFGMVNTGEFGPWNTRAWFAASKADNRVPFNNYGRIDKQQYNAKIWQPLGGNGDFVSISGHFNANKNNRFGSAPLRTDLTRSPTDTRPRIVGPDGTRNRFPLNRDERDHDINFPCRVDIPQAGVADSPSSSAGPDANDPLDHYVSCGTEFNRRYNPSRTGNIRGASRFSITDSIVLSVDPSYQFVKANGGGTVTGNEGLRDINPAGGTASTTTCRTTPTSATNACVAGYLGGTPFFGRDINGDGDTLDTVTVVAPSQTRTRRPGVIANLRYDIDDQHMVRVSYTWDRARHRQTGEVGLLKDNGEPVDIYPIDNPEADVLGVTLQKRDRLSYAILHQIAGEYRGEFFDEKLTVNVGLRAPFFKRELNNYCFTSSASGFVECFGQDEAREQLFATHNPTIQGPQKRTFKYDKLLPSIGFVYDFTNQFSAFASYTKGLSVPSTDNLYNSFFFAPDTEEAKPKPETTDSYDGGVRYRSSKVQAQASVWYTRFDNRIASAFDPELNQSVFRNLGRVNKWGIDGSVAYEPIRELTLYAFGSWMSSKIKDNIQIGRFGTGVNQVNDCDNIPAAALPSDVFRSCAFTAGNRESGAPKYSYGFSALGTLGPLDLGLTAKRTGPRFIFDSNRPVFATGVNLTNIDDANPANDPAIVYDAEAPAYWLFHLDARMNLGIVSPMLEKSYFQVNVYNLFDKFFVGGFDGGLTQAFNTAGTQYGNPPFVQIGTPRTISATINFAF